MIVKAYVGALLLKHMKKKLNYLYFKVRRSVMITIILTVMVMAYNTMLNYFVDENFAIFWYFQVNPTPVTFKRIMVEFVLAITNLMFEIYLMVYTSSKIDFKQYTIFLLMGLNRMDLLKDISIFLQVRNRAPDSEEETLLVS